MVKRCSLEDSPLLTVLYLTNLFKNIIINGNNKTEMPEVHTIKINQNKIKSYSSFENTMK